MKKELSQKDLDELSFMRDWNWVLADFLVKNDNGKFFKQLYQIISEAFDKKDLRGMRLIYNDNNEMVRGLSLNKLTELNGSIRKLCW